MDENQSESDYGSENDNLDDYEGYSDENRLWIRETLEERLTPYQAKLEGELELNKNKKHKGATSLKAKEKKEKELNFKLTQVKKFRDKIEDLGSRMDYIE